MSDAAAIVCDKCNAEFHAESITIDKRIVKINGKDILIEYFACPVCNAVYVVLLADERKYSRFEIEMESLRRRMAAHKMRHNDYIFAQLQSVANVKIKKIKMHCIAMKNKYNGTFTFCELDDGNKKDIIYIPHVKADN